MRRLGTLMGTMVLLVALVAGTALADQLITLTNGADIYTGDAKRQHVEALAGNDLVFGAGGGDKVFGQGGRDKLSGISGNDLIVGGPGEDQLNGADGDDVIVSGDDKMSDKVNCGGGDDIAFVSGPDHVSHNHQGCEEVETFRSMDEVPNPGGEAGS